MKGRAPDELRDAAPAQSSPAQDLSMTVAGTTASKPCRLGKLHTHPGFGASGC